MDIKKVLIILVWVLTSVVATFHVNQSIVVSKGNLIPGDLGDGRFNNYVMEHDYQAFLGYYDWFSPGQFFPEKKTLFYSDSHWGTVGIYILFRFVGFSIESSFQLWFLTIGVLNALCLLYLFKCLSVRLSIACPLTFFGVSSFALVFKLAHAQVLVLFPFILSLCFMVQFLKFKDARKLALAVLFYAYQHYCYMYYGYLMTFIYAFILLIFTSLCSDRGYWRGVWYSVRENKWLLAVSFGFSGVAIGLLYLPYALHSAGAPSMGELRFLAPNLGAWWSASPYSLFYKDHSFYKNGASTIENTLFFGYLAWVLAFIALGYCLKMVLYVGRQRVAMDLKLVLTLFLSGVVVIVFTTTWIGNWGNLYLLIPTYFEPARAFRSFGRIAYLVIVLNAVATGLFLNYLFNLNSRILKIVATTVAVVFAVESFATSQPHAYGKMDAQDRRLRVLDSWKMSGDGDVLLFAPSEPDAPFYVIQLDAWGAALSEHRHTINGYSGSAPHSHQAFIVEPTPERAQALLESLELEGRQITVLN